MGLEVQAAQGVESAGANMPPEQLAAQFSAVIQSLQTKLGGPGTAGSIDSQVTALVGSFDKDGTPDSKLNAKELSAALGITEGQALDFINTFNTTGDTDRALNAEELLSAYEAIAKATEAPPPGESAGAPEGGGGGGGGGGSTEGASQGSGGGGAGLLGKLMELLDKDGDGKISEVEAQEFIDEYAGADGKLSMEELKEGLKAEAEKEDVTLPELSDADLNTIFGEAAKGDESIDAAELMTALNASAESEA